jgi:MFS family permease
MSAPPYLGSFICCIIAAWVSDRYGMRGYIIALSSAAGGTGYLLLTIIEDPTNTAARYTGVWLATCGVFPALCLNMTWLLNNQQGHSKRGAGLALLAIFGQCSSFVSSAVFPDRDA